MRFAFVVAALLFTLAACGKKAPLEHPPAPGDPLPEKQEQL